MVRINLIEPKYLSDQHLRAEHVEILMLLSHCKKYNETTVIPDKFTLGKGHINFFKDKLIYIFNRLLEVRHEMRERDFNINTEFPQFEPYKIEQFKSWQPQDDDLAIIKDRIIERIAKKPQWYKYYGDCYDFADWYKMIAEAR